MNFKNIQINNQSPWVPEWAQHFEVVGEHEIPAIRSAVGGISIARVGSFRRPVEVALRSQSAIHGFLSDAELLRVYRQPHRFLQLVGSHAAVISPDFSVLTGMPKHQKIRSVVQARELSAYFESHGIPIIPSIRWANISDLDFALQGIPYATTIAISTQGLIRYPPLLQILKTGIELVTNEIRPEQVIIYGTLPSSIRQQLIHKTKVTQFATDLARVHNKEGK